MSTHHEDLVSLKYITGEPAQHWRQVVLDQGPYTSLGFVVAFGVDDGIYPYMVVPYDLQDEDIHMSCGEHKVFKLKLVK